MVVGFSSAYTSPALVSMQNPNITSFPVSEQEVSRVQWNFPSNFPDQQTFRSLHYEEKEKENRFFSRLDLIFPFFFACDLFDR